MIICVKCFEQNYFLFLYSALNNAFLNECGKRTTQMTIRRTDLTKVRSDGWKIKEGNENRGQKMSTKLKKKRSSEGF